ncbi:uncharacterized protein LOC111066528 [Drosophila obscura]|uniref:uncharacterized protein LOC111066528 n=1 Tax=Drosophila obscura TaxID=7282 RepID=UPI001BB22972|nr:uncharacterized protein LOC111066528 [Drosophila obscura]
MLLIQALATLLPLLLQASIAAATQSEFADLPANMREQLSPRLLYRKASGVQPYYKDPVKSVRNLLDKLQLNHLNYEIIRATQTSTAELLFEMRSYEQAIEIATAWTRKLRYNAEHGVADTCPRSAPSCVSKDFELKQTERDFYVGGATYRMGRP